MVSIQYARYCSSVLCRWAIALQSCDFTVKHKPEKLHVVPDTLSLFLLEHHEMAEFELAPICRDIPDDPAQQRAVPPGHIKYPQRNSMTFNRSAAIANYFT